MIYHIKTTALFEPAGRGPPQRSRSRLLGAKCTCASPFGCMPLAAAPGPAARARPREWPGTFAAHYMTQPLAELYGGCMVVLNVS